MITLRTTVAGSLIDWAWIGRHTDLIAERLLEHVFLTVVPLTLGVVVAFPLSLIAVRWQSAYGPLIGFTGLLFTIPSLALFVLMIPFTGLSYWTAIIPLTLYTLLILIRNMVTGLQGVDREVRDAATAMGYTRHRLLLTVELPLALPVILAGVRIATVTTIGLVTVSALVGQGGLGQLFTDGFMRRFPTPLITGLVLAVLLAVVADLLLLLIQRVLTPWTRKAT